MAIPYQKQYAEITKRLIDNPNKSGKTRIGNANSRFCESIRIDLKKEFPLQDIKKIKPSNIIHELIWMLRGDTNIKYLIENDCHIWTDDAYRYFNEKYAKYYPNQLEIWGFDYTKESFVDFTLKGKFFDYNHQFIKNGKVVGNSPARYTFGDLDRIYGLQWRQFNGMTDQLSNCIKTLRTNPDDRRMIVVAHNPSDIERNIVGLPSCHNYFQFYTTINDDGSRNLSTYINIRSNDWFLGQPYNAAQYALLTHIVANIVGMKVDELVINTIDAHLYHAHLDAAKEWLKRYDERVINNSHIIEEGDWYGALGCESKINFKGNFGLDDLTYDMIEITNYKPDSYIKAPLLT